MILTLPIDRPFTVTIYVVSFSYFIRLAFQRICLNWHACIVDTYKDVSWLFTLHTISNRECFFVVVVGWLKRCANICGIDLRYVYTTIFDYFLCVNAAYIVRIENHVERNWAPNNRCFARVYVICGVVFFFFGWHFIYRMVADRKSNIISIPWYLLWLLFESTQRISDDTLIRTIQQSNLV